MPASTAKSAASPQSLVRKQFLLTREQNARLKAHASEAGLNEADIVRAGIDLALSEAKAEGDAWRAAWAQATGLWAERDDLDAIYKERRRLRRQRRGSRT